MGGECGKFRGVFGFGVLAEDGGAHGIGEMGDQGSAELKDGGEFFGGGGQFWKFGEGFETALDAIVRDADGERAGLRPGQRAEVNRQRRIEHGQDGMSLAGWRRLAATG